LSISDEASSGFRWPPAIFQFAFVGSAAFAWLVPLPFLFFIPEHLGVPLRLIGGTIFVTALAIAVAGAFAFRRRGTPVRVTEPTRALVVGGVYAYTRNPLYLGSTIGLIGVALVVDSLWFLIATPLSALAITKLAIEREEAYLARKFGDAYLAYKTRVRRWL
jgi:protein-S-isoprenylcysteine O-methyltransferase Ste14